MMPRYPVYVVSKGRADSALTAKFLMRDGVPFHIVVEPQEREAYAAVVGPERVLVLPFANLGLGSIPARNWIWEHAKAAGHARHWILDDNISGMWRRHHACKIRCESGPAFRAVEDFTDRYSNVAVSGMNYYMFALNGKRQAPFTRNVHVYSCLLIQNNIPQRWRGQYNEDTDLCLQVLASGRCTVLFNAFLIWKMTSMTMKGGNTAELYQGDGRLKMARSLERSWPGVVEVKRRYGRPQHVIKFAWRKFTTPLILREGVDLAKLEPDEFGMHLVQVKTRVKSAAIRKMLRHDKGS